MAYMARQDAKHRAAIRGRVSRVACTQKLWNQLSPEARKAAQSLGWREKDWDDGVCPTKYWSELFRAERVAATFLGFEQQSWDLLGFEDAVVGDDKHAQKEWELAVAACVEALATLDMTAGGPLISARDSPDMKKSARVNELLHRMRSSGQSSVETAELLSLLKKLKNADSGDVTDTTSAASNVFSRLHKTPTKTRTQKMKAGTKAQNAFKSGTKPQRTRVRLNTPKRPTVAQPTMVPAGGHRTLFPDSKLKTPSASHSATLRPWKNMKLQIHTDGSVAERLAKLQRDKRDMVARERMNPGSDFARNPHMGKSPARAGALQLVYMTFVYNYAKGVACVSGCLSDRRAWWQFGPTWENATPIVSKAAR
jgi:hypothetical protein